MGHSKTILQNEEGKKIKTMVYVVRGQMEVLLGKKDGEMLGIIKIQKKGICRQRKSGGWRQRRREER